jgi:hypothetical protein
MGLTRPTHVDEETYTAFGNKCRTEKKSIRDILNKLLQDYVDEKIKL